MAAKPAGKILIPTDFSHESMVGLAVGLRRACESDVALLVVYVLETHWYDVDGLAYSIGALTDANWVQARKQLDELCEVLRDTGIRVVPILRQGNVAEEIVKAADAYGVDLILMSSQGDTEHSVGQTTRRVLDTASCEVWSVKGRLPVRQRARGAVTRKTPIPSSN
ncbi:MAG: universal stress protein [Planctomycetes bacterium]|nr:universal stress protein [Planctomycetota bacterium]